ncbi:unnamed protein product [Allacma fusca]|uniref:Uncharacterized protein n=1 Tax=Allacma fusca TaxID=39272 RepID=A0A8J2NSA6_9HEXA|nr:unnamed protein product [Allacma fusca]
MSSKIALVCLVLCYLALSMDLVSGQGWYDMIRGGRGSPQCFGHLHPCLYHPQCCSNFCDLIIRVCFGG